MTKNLKSLGLAVLVSVGLVGAAFAAPHKVNTPRNQRDQEPSVYYGGYQWIRNSATAEMIVCSGRCLLAALITSSGPEGSELRVRNSSVVDGTTGSYALIHRFSSRNTEPGNNPIRYPMVFSNGITVKLNAASTGEEVTVLYLDLDD